MALSLSLSYIELHFQIIFCAPGEVHHPACTDANHNHDTNPNMIPNPNPNPTAYPNPNPTAYPISNPNLTVHGVVNLCCCDKLLLLVMICEFYVIS